MLVFGDEHYGAEFELKGLFGEIINSYSPEIFEKRMIDCPMLTKIWYERGFHASMEGA